MAVCQKFHSRLPDLSWERLGRKHHQSQSWPQSCNCQLARNRLRLFSERSLPWCVGCLWETFGWQALTEKLVFNGAWKVWDLILSFEAKLRESTVEKFNLDGPDGFSSYWHDFFNDLKIFSKHQSSYDSVTIWGLFSSKEKTVIVFLQCKQNGSNYCDVPNDYSNLFMQYTHQQWYAFQQDGTSIHRALLTKNWLNQHIIPVWPCPPRYLKLNPKADLWVIITWRIYANWKQYDTKQDLSEAVQNVWQGINIPLVFYLSNSLPNIILVVL